MCRRANGVKLLRIIQVDISERDRWPYVYYRDGRINEIFLWGICRSVSPGQIMSLRVF